MRKIINIAINPCGIGGTETFSRVLNQHFNNSETYSYDRLKKPLFEAHFVLIKIPIHLKIVRKLFFNKIPNRYLYSYPFSNDNIIIINAPCDFDQIPFRVLRNNKVIYFAHSVPSHILTHGNYFGANRERRLKALQYVDRIVCLSQEYVEPLAKFLQYPISQFRVVTHTIEIEKVNKPKELQRTVITICRLDIGLKRLDRFVEVAKHLPDYNFVIYGEGQDEALIRRMANGISNISFRGATNDIAGAHQKAGIFLLTSEYEGFGITVIESLSQATPVLISENSFAMARRIVQDGINGFVCEKYSVADVINKIRLIEQDYRSYSERAYKSFERFNAQSFIQLWKTIFAEL